MSEDKRDGEEILHAEGLVRTFGKLTAVDHLDISIRRGEIYGFLGPNGAGKTTTVRMLTTVDLPDEGTILINGAETRGNLPVVRRCVGMIQQMNSLDKDISVRENIMHHALMQNLSWGESKRRMKDLCGLLELDDRLDVLISKLSGGWKKRVAIVCALIHEPEILFLDEPTTGLDTQSRNMLWKMIRDINHRGTTIFLTTHYIFEAEELCDRVGIINKGRMVAEGTPEELRSKLGNVTLVTTDQKGEEFFEYYHTREEAKMASADVPEDHNISIRKTNLEDVFLELTGRKI